MTVEQIARICHEVNRAYCAAIGDDSQVSWEDAPAWQKVSAVTGVKFVMDNPFAGPETQHNAWMSLKLHDGWRYGVKKDGQARVHPCLLPYDELPREQKLKDVLFRDVVRGLRPEPEVASESAGSGGCPVSGG